MALSSLFYLSLPLLAVDSALSARIAGFVSMGGSEYMNMKQILEELASRDHEVTLVVPSDRRIKQSDKVAHKVYQVRYEPGFLEDTLIPLDLQERKLEFFSKLSEVLINFCDDALNGQDVLKELIGFDLLIYDSVSLCGSLVGEFLGIPRVEFYAVPPNSGSVFPHMTPMPISYVPQMFSGFSDKMTFAERVMNFGRYLGMLAWSLVIERKMNALKVKYNIRPERSFQEAVGDAEMLIMAADFALEYPQPLLPDQVMVGALSVKDAKPLPPDLENFIHGSGEHGFIIVSFGSNMASILPRAEVDVLATAFGNLKQRVLWRLKGNTVKDGEFN